MKAFLDTMIWLHFRAIEDLDVSRFVLHGESLGIVVPRVTLRELDKHKDSHKSSKVRDRARRALQMMEQIGTRKDFQCKNGIGIEVYEKLPAVDFEAHGLSRESPDESLIASILTYRNENPGETIRFFTDDSTPRIVARTLGIDAAGFPEDLKLAAEPDPIEQENRKLKDELHRLKSVRPVLECGFLVGSKRKGTLSVTVAKHAELSEQMVAAELQRLREQYPHQSPPKRPPPTELSVAILQLADTLGVPASEYARYNRDVDEFIKEMDQYLRGMVQREIEKGLCTSLTIQIANTGNAPAEDVDIWLHFPDGCILYEEFPDDLDEPEPPVLPQSQVDMMMDGLASGLSDPLGHLPPATTRPRH